MDFDVGKNIKEMRKRKGLSQVKLAKMAGISQAALSAIERLDNTPSTYTIKKIADVLNCTVAELLGEEKEVQTDQLTSDERKIIKIYRDLNNEWKRMLLQTAESFSLNPSAQEGLIQNKRTS